jgi:hypothetical protein
MYSKALAGYKRVVGPDYPRSRKLQDIPYLLAYKTPLCGPCETNALSQGGS